MSLHAGLLLVATFFAQANRSASGEQMVLFPTAAWVDAQGEWKVPVHGWVFRETLDRRRFRFWEKLFDLDDNLSRPERDRLRRRLGLFLADNDAGALVDVELGGLWTRSEEAAANGHFQVELTLPAAPEPGTLPGDARTWKVLAARVEGAPLTAAGRVHLVPPTGLSIICDIDDTIRRTRVGSKKKMLRSTFVESFSAIDGVPELLREWKRTLDAEFHYVSVSPWQLYPDLQAFFDQERIPPGSFHLKSVRIKDSSFWTLFSAPDEHKIAVIQELLTRYPRRRFVLVGDASERDPEIYGRLAREHPGQVAHIFIREDSGVGDSDRYAAAFADLPDSMWHLFRDPADARRIRIAAITTTTAPK